MSRTKTIFKEDILKAAQKFIVEKSVGELTARALSKYMNISTQPLYAEFTNMASLKKELFTNIYKELEEHIYNKKTHDDPIINISLNYINFACHNPQLFKTIYLEKHGDTDTSITEFSYHLFRQTIKDNPVYANLSDKKLNTLLTATWVISTGYANLIVSNVINNSQDDIIDFLKLTIKEILESK